MPLSRDWQSGGMKWGMWNTPLFTFSRSWRKLSWSKGRAPCRSNKSGEKDRPWWQKLEKKQEDGSTATPEVLFKMIKLYWRHGTKRLTTRRAKRMTPQLHTSALRPSYFSPLWEKETQKNPINYTNMHNNRLKNIPPILKCTCSSKVFLYRSVSFSV